MLRSQCLIAYREGAFKQWRCSAGFPELDQAARFVMQCRRDDRVIRPEFFDDQGFDFPVLRQCPREIANCRD
jgi:hypothetical protein